jgi:hypothetical protein
MSILGSKVNFIYIGYASAGPFLTSVISNSDSDVSPTSINFFLGKVYYLISSLISVDGGDLFISSLVF